MWMWLQLSKKVSMNLSIDDAGRWSNNRDIAVETGVGTCLSETGIDELVAVTRLLMKILACPECRRREMRRK